MAPVKPGSKYYPLLEYLRGKRDETLVLRMAEVEQLIGEPLPPSARESRAFWSNRSSGGHQAGAWTAAGYLVREVDFRRERVAFGRAMPRYQVRVEGDTIRWDAAMVRALRVHLGVNQVGLAQVLGVRQQTVSEWERGLYAPTRARSKHLTLVAERAGFPFRAADVEQGDETGD